MKVSLWTSCHKTMEGLRHIFHGMTGLKAETGVAMQYFIIMCLKIFPGWIDAELQGIRSTRDIDNHNLGRNRVGLQKALSRVVAESLVISINSDVLFPPSEQKELVSYLPNSSYISVRSDFGHDGFLAEGKKIGKYLAAFLTNSLKAEIREKEVTFAQVYHKNIPNPGSESF